jgi:hypothetical protein
MTGMTRRGVHAGVARDTAAHVNTGSLGHRFRGFRNRLCVIDGLREEGDAREAGVG